MVSSLLLIVLSKLINLGVPFVMAMIVNALTALPNVIPVSLILLYGGLRTANSLVTEVQSTIFLNVTQYATRLLSVDAFRHLHNLSLEWHLKRKTGAVLRTINRGTSSMATLIRIVLFTLAPTLLELIMVCVLMTFSYGWGFAGNQKKEGGEKSVVFCFYSLGQ
jgi:ABC-type multidrug transport system fused ATPase/permease subunit